MALDVLTVASRTGPNGQKSPDFAQIPCYDWKPFWTFFEDFRQSKPFDSAERGSNGQKYLALIPLSHYLLTF